MRSKADPLPSIEAVLGSVVHAVAIVDRNQKLIYANPPFERLFGCDPGDGDSEQWLESQVATMVSEGCEEGCEGQFGRWDSAAVWTGLCEVRPVRRRGGEITHRVITIRDVTSARRMEAAWEESEDRLKAVNAELARSNDELQQFAFVVSHELQEPLSTMRGVADRLMDLHQDSVDRQTRDYLLFIRSASHRMRDMIHGLLAYSRAGHSKTAGGPACDSGAALLWAVNHMEPGFLEADGSIEHDSLPVVAADFDGLTQVFQHLLSNALKYRGPEPPRIRVSAKVEGEHWRFCVADNGPGIDPAYHDRVFRVFKRLHGREVPGAGVGLALCRRIVESFGGRMWVESQPGEGAQFFFTLPQGELKRLAATGSQRA